MKQKGYGVIFKQRAFLQFTIANVINRLGDSIDMIAFTWLVYQISGSASWCAVVLGVNMLPNVILQPFAGALVEHLSKKRVIMLCDWARGILTCMIAVLYVMNCLNPWILLVITFLNNAFESLRNPASTAIQPLILAKEHYEFGLSFSQTSTRVFELVGTGLAGVIIATIGIEGAIVIDALSFFLCAIIISSIRVKEDRKRFVKISLKGYVTSLKEGFVHVRKLPVLFLLCFIAMALNALLVPYNSFFAPLIRGTLHMNADLLSISSVALSIGMLFGTFLYPYLHKKRSHRFLFLVSMALLSAMYFAGWGVSLYPNVIFIYSALGVGSLLSGLGVGVLNCMTSVCVIQKVEQVYLARFSSIFGAMATAAMPITSFVLSVACKGIAVETLFLYAGIVTVLLAVCMIFVNLLKEL